MCGRLSEGTIEDDLWTPPNRATEVVISVHVSDGENATVSQSKNVTVTKPVTVEPVTVEPPIVPEQQRDPDPQPPDLEVPEGAEAWNIIPGVGIEYVAPGKETIKVSLGDTVEQVTALAERSDWIEDNSQIHFHPRLGDFYCIYENGKTVAIGVFDAVFKTKEGIGVGAHVDDVIAEYGNPEEIGEGEKFTFYMYFAHGYMFSVPVNKHHVFGIVVGLF